MRDSRVHGDPNDRIPDASQLSRFDAYGYWYPQAQSPTVVIRLDFVALLREVEVGLGRHEEGRDVVELVLLLFGVLEGNEEASGVERRGGSASQLSAERKKVRNELTRRFEM